MINRLSFSLWLVGLVCFSFSCTNEDAERRSNELKNISYKDSTSVFLRLDAESPVHNLFYQIVDLGDSKYYCFFNRQNFRFYFYNLSDTDQYFRTTPFAKEGPNGIGSMIFSFDVQPDSTILLHSYYLKSLIQVNFSGEVLKRRKLLGGRSTFSSMKTPIIETEEQFYFYSENTSFNGNVQETPILYALPKQGNDSLMDVGVRLPEFYQNDKEGKYVSELSVPAIAYNERNRTILIGFPLSDSISILNAAGEFIEKRYFGHPDFHLKPKIKANQLGNDPISGLKAMLSYDRYSSLLYDATNNIYLRRLNWQTPEEQLKNNVFGVASNVIVADSAFNIIGQVAYNGSTDQVIHEGKIFQFSPILNSEDSLMVNIYSIDLDQAKDK